MATFLLGISMMAFVASACAEEDPDVVDDATGTISTPATGLDPANTPDTTLTPDLTTPSASTPMAGPPDDASPTPASEGVSLDSVRSWFEQNAPEIDALAITGVDFSDGILTIETEWDSANESDAADLCETALDIDVTGALSGVEVVGSDGSMLTEC